MGKPAVEMLLVGRDDFLADQLMVEMTHRYGASIFTVRTIPEALKRIESFRLEALFVDLEHSAPDQLWEDPIDVIPILRQNPRNRDAVIVVFSPNEALEPLARAHRAGADYFLIKPLLSPQLDRLMHVIYSRMTESRRRSQRTEIEFPVLCSSRRRRHIGASVNLSASGMLLNLTPDIHLREKEEVELVFPYGGQVPEPFILAGHVARVEHDGKIAVAFSDVPDHQRNRLQLWVELALFCQNTRPSQVAYPPVPHALPQ